MHFQRRAPWWVLFLACFPAGMVAGREAPYSLADDLRQAGIEPSRQGIEKFLTSLRPSPAREARIRALLADLGHDDFPRREKATAELIALPFLPPRLLQEAAKSDPETRRRIAYIQEASPDSAWEGRLLLALRIVEAERVKGLAPLVLELMPQWPEAHLARAAAGAAAASAQRSDGPALREAAAAGRCVEARAAAVEALAAVFGPEAEKELVQRLTDTEPRVALAAAVALLDQGNHQPLAALVRLLEAEQPEARLAAVHVLRAVTGKRFDGETEDGAEQRARAVAAWRDWVRREGATARLEIPVRRRPAPRGRILIAVYSDRVLREIDATSGKTLFEAGGFTYPWGAHATPGGHRLGVDYQARWVVEYDARGKECWRHDVPGNPTGIARLDNGRTLVALAEPGQVIEMDRAGKVVWQVTLAGRPTTAQRLENGNTLVSLQVAGKVVEIDRQGKVVWEVAGVGTPHTAERLDNGHVLVCDMGGGNVVEYDRAGKAVWSRRGVNNPAQAQRLPNGNTLVSSADGLQEIDPKGKVVRTHAVSRSRFFAY
jgi:hypothetical protein